MPPALHQLPVYAPGSRRLHVVIETPKGSRNKLAFDPELGFFKLMGVLPEGSSFPYDFGFVPSTLADDGDPLDVLLLMDAATYPGVVVEARLIGVLEAEQPEDGQPQRNDRLLAVAAESRLHRHLHDLGDLTPQLLHEIEHFFHSYNEAKGQPFRIVRRSGKKRAEELVHKAAAQAQP
ncbi:inorganic diphosphatase [Hymenobacter sp. 15J16-1T3B]|uniref:inorganic diphosphatase n=1 Tax=Hymenobacter sp. 15J16-1T3B TaxID=2886941 RepID=UPI001D100435|nr:inorganic diphosphatase [Hymenobacter sp. 15J16-1T3B]MCC3157799.1 inorganic diphosphatase [Hymenobacter sp. 15J16-1T3B]